MADDLPRLIRAIYDNDTTTRRDEPAAAFDRAVRLLLARRPLLTLQQARAEVATILARQLAAG
jgi:hypothetical protein